MQTWAWWCKNFAFTVFSPPTSKKLSTLLRVVKPFLAFSTWKKLMIHLNTLFCLTLFDAGIKGRAWRIISCLYSKLRTVVKSGFSISTPFPVLCGIQQGSVLSPTFSLIVMDKLLMELKENKASISICNLYLRGAAHADDMRTIATRNEAILLKNLPFMLC